MVKLFPAYKDAVIKSNQPTYNFGKDPILEVSKLELPSSVQVARSLIQFPMTSVENYIQQKFDGSVDKIELQLFIAQSENLMDAQEVLIHPISQSWDDGTGTSQYPNLLNVTWNNRKTGQAWTMTGSTITSSLSASYTLSYYDQDTFTDPI